MFKLIITGMGVSSIWLYLFMYHKDLILYYALKMYYTINKYLSPPKGDFIKINHKLNNLKINSKLIDGKNYICVNNNLSNVTECETFFMSIDVTVNQNEGYSIILKKQNYNIYVVGNKINYNFIQWYLDYVYNIYIKLDNIVDVSIIDKNMNIIKFDKNHTIQFYDTYYEILK